MVIAEHLKESHPNTVCLVKCGMFYRCYEKDAYIISYLLGYKLNSTSANDMAGFPSNSIKEVTNKLIGNKVDYKIFKTDKFSLETISSFSMDDENNYEEIYEKSYRHIKLECRINKLTQKLIEKIESIKMDEVLTKVEEIIYDELK